MIIDNVYVFTPDKAFVKGGIILDGDKILQVYEEKDAPQLNGDVMDGKGCYAIPGLIDLHFHGCKGDDSATETRMRLEGSRNMRHR